MLQLNGKVKATAIVSTACKSGSKSFGRFVVNELGFKYFIGPTGSPKFYNTILFTHIFYHKLFKTNGRISDAFNSYDDFYKNPPDYVSISVRTISFFPEQGVALVSATASLGTIAARSNLRLNRYCDSARYRSAYFRKLKA